eukprot:CAMPEP_0117421382 /NCGR_PEP_ID=MMETSP0758-20121206/2494_1 /TAXON_ID=63605 /ORGANISM="Percolomonas cosmopolitus, Strain AE-1 (ATCC 50343)" /LENGTH=428 /DNA_ID=CAMNT_0005203491 /DNA_START=263 /DNA_END=1545 /DNA_ORIENTATION=-
MQDEEQEEEDDEENNLEARLQAFRNLVQDISGDQQDAQATTAREDFARVQHFAELSESEAKLKIEEDEVISAYYVSKYNRCIVQTKKYIMNLDSKTGKQLHLYIPKGDDVYTLEIMENPVSIHHNMMFVPLSTGYEFIDLVNFKKMGEIKIPMESESSTFLVPMGNRIWLHVSDNHLTVIGSNGSHLNTFDTTHPDHIVISPEFIMDAMHSQIFQVDETISHSVPLFYNHPESPLLGFYQENSKIGGFYTIKPTVEPNFNMDMMQDLNNSYEIAFIGRFEEEKRFYQGRDSFKTVKEGILSDIWKQTIPYQYDSSFKPVGLLEEDHLSVLYRVSDFPLSIHKKIPHFHKLGGVEVIPEEGLQESFYVLQQLEKNTGSSLCRAEFAMPNRFILSYAERISSKVFLVFYEPNTMESIILLFNQHGTLCSA